MSSLAVVIVALAPRALAQAVPNGSFEVAGSGWTETSLLWQDPLDLLPPFSYPWAPYETGFTYDATHARGALGARMLGDANGGYYWIERSADSAPFLVTRERLSFATWPANSPGLAFLADHPAARVAGPVSPDSLGNWETSVVGACAQVDHVRLVPDSWQEVWFDDVVLSGPACAEFTDADGDGACPSGLDLDGDGDCAEGTEPDIAVQHDCDDSDPGIGACLTLVAPDWVDLGVPQQVTVSGAVPGARVLLVGSLAEGNTCPPPAAGLCVDLAAPLDVLGLATASPAGVATFQVVLDPAGYAPFEPLVIQAVTASGSRSAATTLLGRLPDEGPRPPGGGIYNGHQEVASVGWPHAAESYGMYPPRLCDASSWVTTPARGARALRLDLDPQATACSGVAHGWGFVVTHTELSWAQSGAGAVLPRLADGSTLALAPASILAADGFTERKASVAAACGQVARLDLDPTNTTPVVFDDLVLAGPVCPQLLDPDGDGRCAGGRDRDGDGACVTPGEFVVPPVGVAVPTAVMVEDFEAQTTEVYTAATVAPLRTRGAVSGHLEPPRYGGYGVDFGYSDWSLAPAVVTHRTLVFWMTARGNGDWLTTRADLYVRGPSLPSTIDYHAPYAAGPWVLGVPGQWVQYTTDASGACGYTVDQLTMEQPFWGYDEQLDALDDLMVDDVGLAGAICAIYVDADGDGICPEGVDLDGDGSCVDAGEPVPLG